MWQGQVSIIGPKWILSDIGDNDWFFAVRRRSARSRGRTDGGTVDRAGIALWKARRCAVPKTVAIRIQQQNRRKRTFGQLFDKPAQGIEDQSKQIALGYHLEKPFLSGEQCLSPLAIFNIGIRSVPFDNVSRLVAQRHAAEQEPAILSVKPPQTCFNFNWLATRQRRPPFAF